MSLIENLREIEGDIPENVTLIAVSKTKPISQIQELYNAGQRDFGENKIQEMVEKAEHLPKDIRWHMIGHLQTNKIKYISEFVHLIHGVDKAKKLKEINKRAKQAGRVQDILLQIHIAKEDSKFGMTESEAREIFNSKKLEEYDSVRIVGLMGMATNVSDENLVRSEFKGLYSFFKSLQNDFPQIKYLSMGMSGDYKIAIEEGSNMVRIGSAIFGNRNYS